MPKLLIYKDIFIFLIFAVNIHESRRHVHVAKKSVRNFYPAKIWLEPEVEISKQGDFKKNELKEILEIAVRYKNDLLNQIERFFNNEEIEVIRI